MTIHLSLSGGMDSTTLLAWARDRFPNAPILAYGFDYGQRHVRELESAERIAEHYGVPLKVIPVPTMSSPALTEGQVMPHGHYSDASMAQTVVQGRNLLFASLLVAHTRPGDSIALGVHAGDHAQYPDCRPTFWSAFQKAVTPAYQVLVLTPFLLQSKAEIASTGIRLDAPLGLSWSCYEGGDRHCGRCGTCVERAEAFHLAGAGDPTSYVDPDFWRLAVAEHAARA